jgi:CRP-like cAMP-binding protein
MAKGDLGKQFRDGDDLCREGEPGDHMFVIQKGQVEVITHQNGRDTSLAVLGPGSIIGEMAIFEREPRSATVRARGDVVALTVDKKNLLRRVSEDPTMAFRLIQTLSGRLRELNRAVASRNDDTA